MVNLNKQRIVIYAYLFAVLTLISGLSFNVQGDKITGHLILESASNIKSSIYEFGIQNILTLMFMFLMSLVVVFFVLRYIQQVKNTITPENMKFYGAIITVMLIVSFFSVGFYTSDNDKITGAVSGIESITGYEVYNEEINKYAIRGFTDYFNPQIKFVTYDKGKYKINIDSLKVYKDEVELDSEESDLRLNLYKEAGLMKKTKYTVGGTEKIGYIFKII